MQWWTRLLATFGLALFFLTPAPAFAQANVGEAYNNIMSQGLVFANVCSGRGAACECRDSGRCTLEQLLQVVLNVAWLIMGLSGTVALLMFVWGGIDWITAQGKQGKIEQGRDTMVAATIGLVVIFSAYALVNLVLAILIGGSLSAPLEQNIQNAGGTSPFTTVNPPANP